MALKSFKATKTQCSNRTGSRISAVVEVIFHILTPMGDFDLALPPEG